MVAFCAKLSLNFVVSVSRPIHDAVESGCLQLVKLLVQHGADFSAEYGGRTPLELAHSLGHIDIVHHIEGE